MFDYLLKINELIFRMDYQVCKTNNDRFDKTMHTHDKEIAFNKSILIDDLTM